MIIDSHCHLDYPELYGELDSVLSRADKNLVKFLLTICTTLDSFVKINNIVDKYRNVYGTFGIHPHETKSNQNVDTSFIKDKLKNKKKIIGIGETGLDYYYNHSDKDIQKKSFVDHINAAKYLNMPVIVHSRDAEQDTFNIIKNEKKNSNLKVLIHCFTGSKEFAHKLIDIGCYISISGIITFKNSLELVRTVENIPIDSLLVETDSPYLSPVPFRGKPNEPSYIKHTIKKISEIKKIDEDLVMKKTSSNFINLFNLKINEI
jgi:TatD DNase family protein